MQLEPSTHILPPPQRARRGIFLLPNLLTTGNLFAGKAQSDQSGAFGSPPTSGLADCSADPYHNAWYQLATGLPAGATPTPTSRRPRRFVVSG